MTYKCGHRGQKVIIKEGDYTRVVQYYNWLTSNKNKCFYCFIEEKNDKR